MVYNVQILYFLLTLSPVILFSIFLKHGITFIWNYSQGDTGVDYDWTKISRIYLYYRHADQDYRRHYFSIVTGMIPEIQMAISLGQIDSCHLAGVFISKLAILYCELIKRAVLKYFSIVVGLLRIPSFLCYSERVWYCSSLL